MTVKSKNPNTAIQNPQLRTYVAGQVRLESITDSGAGIAAGRICEYTSGNIKLGTEQNAAVMGVTRSAITASATGNVEWGFVPLIAGSPITKGDRIATRASGYIGKAQTTQVSLLDATAGGNFGNQPANDGIEIVSDSTADITQTITLYGVRNGALTTLVTEVVALTGTTQAVSTYTNWYYLLGARLSAACAGTITIREASGNQTITTIAAASLTAGIAAATSTNAYGLVIRHDCSSSSTASVGVNGTGLDGAALNIVAALENTTEGDHGTTPFGTITEFYIGAAASSVNVNFVTNEVTDEAAYCGVALQTTAVAGVPIDCYLIPTQWMKTGSSASGVSMEGAITTPIDMTGVTGVTTGIKIPRATGVTNAVLIGDSSSEGGGMAITATKNKHIVCYSEIEAGAIVNTSNLRCQWNRLRISGNADITGGGQVAASQNTLYIYGHASTTSLGTWAYSGVWGAVAIDGTASTNLGSGAYLAGVVAQISAGAGYTGASGSYTAGLYVVGNSDTASTMTGDYSGILIENQGAKAFTNGINILGTGVTTGINIGAVTTGISMAGVVTTGVSITGGATTAFNTSGTFTGASGRAAKFAGTVNNANYGDGYSFVESELTLTGTCAGHVSAFGSWVNVITGTTGANYICAQTNGVYEEATGVLTNTTVIFGMRMQSLLAEAPSESFPFSCVSNTNIITALFSCNAGSSDMGTITNAGSDSGKLVPLYKETSTGTTYYVKLYATA